MKKEKPGKGLESLGGLIYSTEPDLLRQTEITDQEETPEPSRQDLRIMLDRKLKGGKQVTVIFNFVGNEEDLETLGKHLKSKCGCGGSVKEGEILLQGDFREKVKAELTKLGYRYKQQGG